MKNKGAVARHVDNNNNCLFKVQYPMYRDTSSVDCAVDRYPGQEHFLMEILFPCLG